MKIFGLIWLLALVLVVPITFSISDVSNVNSTRGLEWFKLNWTDVSSDPDWTPINDTYLNITVVNLNTTYLSAQNGYFTGWVNASEIRSRNNMITKEIYSNKTSTHLLNITNDNGFNFGCAESIEEFGGDRGTICCGNITEYQPVTDTYVFSAPKTCYRPDTSELYINKAEGGLVYIGAMEVYNDFAGSTARLSGIHNINSANFTIASGGSGLLHAAGLGDIGNPDISIMTAQNNPAYGLYSDLSVYPADAWYKFKLGGVDQWKVSALTGTVTQLGSLEVGSTTINNVFGMTLPMTNGYIWNIRDLIGTDVGEYLDFDNTKLEYHWLGSPTITFKLDDGSLTANYAHFTNFFVDTFSPQTVGGTIYSASNMNLSENVTIGNLDVRSNITTQNLTVLNQMIVRNAVFQVNLTTQNLTVNNSAKIQNLASVNSALGVSSGSTHTATGTITTSQATTTASANAFVCGESTAATAAVPVRVSTSLLFYGRVWNGSTSNIEYWYNNVEPKNYTGRVRTYGSNNITSSYKWSYQAQNGIRRDVMALTENGTLNGTQLNFIDAQLQNINTYNITSNITKYVPQDTIPVCSAIEAGSVVYNKTGNVWLGCNSSEWKVVG